MNINSEIGKLDDEFYLDADAFFKENKGVTFDDISLATHYSETLPKDADPTTQLTEQIQLSTPTVSSDMDTVTESEMAIQMALNGGLGLMHSNLSHEQQLKEVGKVKHNIHGVIRKPITIFPNQCIGDIIKLITEKNYSFSTFPVIEPSGKFLGLLSGECIEERYKKIKVTDAMVPIKKIQHIFENQLGENPIKTADKFFNENIGKSKLIIIDKNHNFKGLITNKDISRIKKEENSDIKASTDSEHRLRTGVTLHMMCDNNGNLDKNKIIEQVGDLVEKGIDIVAVSTAHGYSNGVGDMVEIVRQNFKDLDIMAGNVTSARGVEYLANKGANVVKVGQGPGSICTTRVETGVGVPQMTAAYVCSKAAKILGVKTIIDGGIKVPGDIAKALTLGNAVMLGGLLAGSDEAPGDTIEFKGKKYKTYRGMGSLEAMKEGSAARYGKDTEDKNLKLTPEGISGAKECIGPVGQTIQNFRAYIQSSMGYNGANTLEEFQKLARYTPVSPASQIESKPHDIIEMNIK